MPNEQTLNAKKVVVQALTEKLRSAAGVLVDYSGTSVAEDTEMRARMRAENVDYAVVKNTLMRFAIKNVGYDELDSVLNGTTSLAVSASDVVAPARLVKEYASKFENHFFIKGGFMDGKVLSADEVNALAAIPPLPILRAQLLGTMLAPISTFAAVIKAIAEKRGDGGIAEPGTTEASGGDAVEAPDENPIEASGEDAVEAPCGDAAEASGENPIEASGGDPIEAPGEDAEV
ncbi:MAG: 50S ribosomal protein L10 [Oscillospiraceae bacterium]|jgi:large subunit ribosomal protein L10|nr:50S ribosomal protein L10 [Oscillospiraceae bacterium]